MRWLIRTGGEVVHVHRGFGVSTSSMSMRLVPAESIRDVLICEAVSVVSRVKLIAGDDVTL